MKWKDFAIGKKMAVGFGIVLFLLAASTVASFIGVGGIVGNAEQVIAGNRLDGFLAQKEVDHLNWSSKVNGLITDERINELDVELDDHKCSLGSWLYSDERKRAETLVPDLIPLLKKIEAPHEHLHKSAIGIQENYRAADPGLPAFMTARESDHLKWAETVHELFLHNLPELVVETDASNCPLGKWLEGSGALKAAEAAPDLVPIIESMKAPHRKIHQSALDIQKAWKQIHPGLPDPPAKSPGRPSSLDRSPGHVRHSGKARGFSGNRSRKVRLWFNFWPTNRAPKIWPPTPRNCRLPWRRSSSPMNACTNRPWISIRPWSRATGSGPNRYLFPAACRPWKKSAGI